MKKPLPPSYDFIPSKNVEVSLSYKNMKLSLLEVSTESYDHGKFYQYFYKAIFENDMSFLNAKKVLSALTVLSVWVLSGY